MKDLFNVKLRLLTATLLSIGLLHASPGFANGVDTPATQASVNTGTTLYSGISTDYGASFVGIPYAAAPVDALRWQPPQPAVIGSEFDATVAGAACPQIASPYGVGSENEDCLSLNVDKPKPRQGKNAQQKLPVVVWMHGGSLTSGVSSLYDPVKLVKRNLVVVTINYRLGALGYLSHPALAAETKAGNSGNYGLMDQQAALRWVRDNIAAFGGDPDNVTLSGQSAGGYSVLANLVSPASAGLFHKAIVQSGVYTLEEPTQQQWEVAGSALAVAMGCEDQSAECLRNLEVATILENQGSIATQYPIVVDGATIPQQITNAISTGEFHHMPVMNGSTSDEFSLYVAALNELVGNPVTEENYLQSIIGAGIPEVIAPLAQAEYPVSDYASPGLALTALGTDAAFACNAQAMSFWLAAFVPTYAYEFADPDPAPLLPPISFPYGAYHGSDVQYIMQTPNSLIAEKSKPQKALEHQMLSYWASFARHGNPNVNLAPYWFRFKTSLPVMQSLKPWLAYPTLNFHQKHHCEFWYGFADS